MQLLDCLTTAIPQCVAFSFVGNPPLDGTDAESFVPEPMMQSSPLATVSGERLMTAIRELVAYISASLKASTTREKSIATSLLNEDLGQLTGSPVQVFRPLTAQGVALHYRFVRHDITLLKLLSAHLLAANSAGGPDASTKSSAVPAMVAGVVFCVGFTGLSVACASSALQNTLPQRMADCLTFMTKVSPKEPAAIKSILSSFLLVDDELRINNEMAGAPDLLLFQAIKTDDKNASNMGMMSPLAGSLNLRKLAGNNAGAGAAMGKDTDGGDSGCSNPQSAGVHLSIEPSGADVARLLSEQIKVLAISEADTVLRKYTAPSQERKANLDLAGGNKSRFSRRKTSARGATRDPDFDNFDYKGPVKEQTARDARGYVGDAPIVSPTPSHGKKDAGMVKAAVPALAAARGDVGPYRRASISSVNSGGPRIRGSRKSSGAQFVGGDDETHVSGMSDNYSRRRRSNGHVFDDDASNISDARSGITPQGKMLVNVALNEDLSCSYKLSQLSSCTVEGVVQVRRCASVVAQLRVKNLYCLMSPRICRFR